MKLKVHEHKENNFYLVSKTKILLLFLMTATMGFGQIISFDYDAAGNQIIRQICKGCHTRLATPPKEVADLKPTDLKKFFPEDVISYYPNPVKEALYLKWELANENAVQSIQLYSINGALIKSIDHLENQNDKSIFFRDYPEGIYLIQLSYTNGEQKSIQIVKQE